MNLQINATNIDNSTRLIPSDIKANESEWLPVFDFKRPNITIEDIEFTSDGQLRINFQ